MPRAVQANELFEVELVFDSNSRKIEGWFESTSNSTNVVCLKFELLEFGSLFDQFDRNQLFQTPFVCVREQFEYLKAL